MPGVYISYPFCNQKCSFCNFASSVGSASARADYHSALCLEISKHRWEWQPETLYLGGGTPSLLEIDALAQILGHVPRAALIESTMECAPGTITRDRVRGWRGLGLDRVSLGVQSFAELELRRTGRNHTAETVRQDVEMLRAEGIRNINIDLIAGLPYQTLESWNNSLNSIESLDAPHVSVYLFEMDEDSNLGRELLEGGIRYSAAHVPSGDLAAGFYEVATARLSTLGLKRYEISNFARPGSESRHNLKYWQHEPYAGFGLDAHSFNGQERWGNPDSLLAYLAANGASHCEREPIDRAEEHFFVGLRLTRGIQPTAAERDRFAEPIARWLGEGMLESQGATLRLSSSGVLLSNEILQDFINA